MSPSIARLLSRLDRWPRRLAALICLVLAAASAVAARRADSAGASGSPAGVRIVVADRDLGVAHTLTLRDLTTAAWPRTVVPAGAAARPGQLVGRRLAGPVRVGEAVTDARLVGSGMTDGLPPGQVAVSVPTGPGVAALVHPGDRVDVLAGPPEDVGLAGVSTQPDSATDSARGDATVIVEAAAVLAVLPAAAAFDNSDAQVIVATDRGTALRIVAVERRQTLAVVVDPP